VSDHVTCPGRVSATSCGAVELGHEIAVGGSGRGEVVVSLFQTEAQVDDLLRQVGDLLIEGVDVDGGAEPGLAPRLVAEGFGEPFFELLDPAVEPVCAFVCGEKVGL
jgi:hypothetical protein